MLATSDNVYYEQDGYRIAIPPSFHPKNTDDIDLTKSVFVNPNKPIP